MSTVLNDDRRRYALNPAEAAQALGMCRASIYNMIARGELRAVKLGRSTRVPVAEIERLLGGDSGEAA